MIKVKITYTDIVQAKDIREAEDLFLQQMEKDVMYKAVSAYNFEQYIEHLED